MFRLNTSLFLIVNICWLIQDVQQNETHAHRCFAAWRLIMPPTSQWLLPKVLYDEANASRRAHFRRGIQTVERRLSTVPIPRLQNSVCVCVLCVYILVLLATFYFGKSEVKFGLHVKLMLNAANTSHCYINTAGWKLPNKKLHYKTVQ